MQAQASQDCGNCGAGLNVDNGAAGWIGNCGQTRANHLVASDSQLRGPDVAFSQALPE